MENKAKNQNNLFIASPRALVLILTLAAVGITLLMLPFSHVSEEPVPTPAPTAVPSTAVSVVSVDIVLSATPTPRPAVIEYPEGAMDLIVNGTVVCTLPSGDMAEGLILRCLQYWTELPLEKNEYLISAEVNAAVSIAAPSGEGTLMTADEAYEYLTKNPSLLPVLRTIRTVDVEETARMDTEVTSPLLPPGMTVIRKLERPSYMLFYTDKEYEGLTLISRTEADGFHIGSPATGRVTETGAEPNPAAEPTPSPAPGSLSKDCPVSLGVPVKGTVKMPFGRDANGVMHYGIEYNTEAGYAVYSPGDGVVIYCGRRGSLGYVIEIRHDDTGFVSRLIGMDADMNVELYQRVEKSDRLGKVAAAPDKSKPVFRYELLIDGIPTDPLPYIR